MGTWNDGHIADCETCQSQIASPRPFDDDLCHMNIRPDDDYGDLSPVQCPHIAAPGSKICMHHLKGAHESYIRIVARTAAFN